MADAWHVPEAWGAVAPVRNASAFLRSTNQSRIALKFMLNMMQRRRVGAAMAWRGLVVVLALLVSGCVHSRTFPEPPAFARGEGPARLKLFADRHGAIYPSDQPDGVDPTKLKNEASLRVAAVDPAAFEAGQQALLDDIARFADDKSRLFVFVHGFNDPPSSAKHSFARLRSTIAWQPGDGLIELHWDGLQAGFFSPQMIWFESTGSSQMVGEYALRPILNRVRGKTVVMISFSRGGSVLLSALGDPSYHERRAAQDLAELGTRMPIKEPFRDRNGNRIHVILLAPAIGCPDFWRPGPGSAGEPRLRPMPDDLVSLQFTVNKDDWVLRKVLGVRLLAASFNATNLGWDEGVGATLSRHYSLMRAWRIDSIGHDFGKYAEHPGLKVMLDQIGVSHAPRDAQDTRHVEEIPLADKPKARGKLCTTHF